MIKLLTILKLFLKFVYINSITNFRIGAGSGVGGFSSIIFSSENNSDDQQSITIGKYAGIRRFCELQVWDNNHIVIKDYSTLNDGCKLLGDVVIERHCVLSANIFASSGNHYALRNPAWLIKDQDKAVLGEAKGRKEHSKPIRIEEDCWIGYGVFIGQGIYIGRGAVIGANSVVTKDVDPYSIQVGSPNREIKKRLDFNPPDSVSAFSDEHLPYFYRGFDQRREILTESRRQKVILSYHESVVVLQSGSNFNSICFSGKSNAAVREIILVVVWQGKYEWSVKVGPEEAQYTLTIDSSSPAGSGRQASQPGTMNYIAEKFNVISFYTQEIPGIEYPFGLNSVKIMQ